MPSKSVVLGFDTSAAHCAAALFADGSCLASRAQSMSRGQAEHLFPLIEDVMAAAGVTWGDIAAIGVGVGPGNFTGIRVGVSAARGLAMGLGVPSYGITSFEAATGGQAITAIVPAPRDQVYLKRPDQDAELVDVQSVQGIERIAGLPGDGAGHAEAIARLTWDRSQDPSYPTPARPAPLYIKAADAAPARDAPPEIIP